MATASGTEYHYGGDTVVLKAVLKDGANASTKAEITTTQTGTSDADLTFIARNPGPNGNDISIVYLDKGIDHTNFALSVGEDNDIAVTLERRSRRAAFETTYANTDANIRFEAITAGSSGNNISVEMIRQSDSPAAITSISLSGKVATVTTTAVHGLAVGDVIGISGVRTTSGVNGCWQVHEVTSTTVVKVQLDDEITGTPAGLMKFSKMEISVSSNDITIELPIDQNRTIIGNPRGVCWAWGTSASAVALAAAILRLTDDSGEITDTTGAENFPYPLDKIYLKDGRDSAIETTALDIKTAIEGNTVGDALVEVVIPSGQTGAGKVENMLKIFLAGGGNASKIDPDDNEWTIKIYDPWQNLIETITDGITRLSTGVYQCNYQLPIDYTSITQEWSCVWNGYPVKTRQQVDVTWSLPEIEAEETSGQEEEETT